MRKCIVYQGIGNEKYENHKKYLYLAKKIKKSYGQPKKKLQCYNAILPTTQKHFSGKVSSLVTLLISNSIFLLAEYL